MRCISVVSIFFLVIFSREFVILNHFFSLATVCCALKGMGTICYRCKRVGHLKKCCPEKEKLPSTNIESSSDKMLAVTGHGNRSTRRINIAGHEIFGRLDSGADCNVLKEIVWNLISGYENVSKLERTNKKLEGVAGTVIPTLAKIMAKTTIENCTCQQNINKR